MVTLKLRHVERFKDRYGKTRYYFRVGKGPRVPLVGEPGSIEFRASYEAASGQAKTLGKAGQQTFRLLADKYYQNPKFLKTKLSSREVTRNILERFLKEHGHRLVAQMTLQHVDALMAQKADTPAAANNFLKKLRVLMKFARRLGWITVDPTIDAEQFKQGTHHTWTEAEIAKYENRWPLGTRERVAFDFHLYAGQRRHDVCFFTQEHIELRDERLFLQVKQQKTGKELLIPMHPNLERSYRLWNGIGKTIISKNDGEAYTVESYGNLMADAIAAARLPARCVLHGLRKAASRRLAEAGCTPHQIAAITGHDSLDEIERYTKAAAQVTLAGQAIESLGKFKKA